ncbi:hypothetical protein FD24_GL001386 [Lactiplantibacillus pentosus DSM 20314]|uniref:Uncharacterized protein n=1 Tax=Lactiplantibacillus pentosus DSM 20314 TaxID=1423791 RepID=A0A837RES5_LACPE|nr:hypothetical protein FD24_GL001386 [Lactiplantibacillus pentosus DSM 20314]
MELPYFWLYLMLVAASILHGLAPTADNKASSYIKCRQTILVHFKVWTLRAILIMTKTHQRFMNNHL